jgi:hypothetical protein
MTISVGQDQLKNIVEIWDAGPNTIQVVTASYRTIRISALGNIRSGTKPNYFAHYEEQVEIEPSRVKGCEFGPTHISRGKTDQT